MLPDLETPLENAFFNNKLDQVIAVIKRHNLESFPVHSYKTIRELISDDDKNLLRINGIGREGINLIRELRNLYFQSVNQASSQAVPEDDEVFKNTSTSISPQQLPNKEEYLENCTFVGKYEKLVKRLLNVKNQNPDYFQEIDTIEDLLNMSESDLWDAPFIGKKYVESWQSLKTAYGSGDERSRSPLIINEENVPTTIDEEKYNILSGASLNYAYLSKDEIKCLNRLVFLGLYEDAYSVLLVDSKSVRRAGKKFHKSLDALKNKIKNFADRMYNDLSLREPGKSLVVMENQSIALNELDLTLLKDIEIFIECLPETNQEIFQKRWGFVESKETLETIASEHGLTRERIRQKELEDNKRLLSFLSYRSQDIRAVILKNTSESISEKMPMLSSCFEDNIAFTNFIGHISGLEGLASILNPEVPLDLLVPYFQVEGQVLSWKFVEEIVEEYFSDKEDNLVVPKNSIEYLEDQGVIAISGSKVLPRLLSKNEAAACVLANHESGLPWLDIAKIANNSEICKTPISESRRDATALNDLDYIYLSGKGVYKHTKYITESEEELLEINASLARYINDSDRKSFNLVELLRDCDNLDCHDYYVVRHAVKKYGKRQGLFFKGQSQADTVSLGRQEKSINQQDVIIEAMRRQRKALTKAEIAGLIKSKSLGHASFYLDKMMTEGKVVQVDRMLYTTPDIAFGDIDIHEYEEKVLELMLTEGRPVDPSWFQECINPIFNESFSKYFYTGLARYLSIHKGWFRRHNLFSVSEIEYRNLHDVFDNHCSSNFTSHENINRVRKEVAITNKAAEAALYRWKKEESYGSSLGYT